MKKIILIIIMLNLFTLSLSNDTKKDEKIAMIMKSLEQRIGLLEKKVTATKKTIEERQYENKIAVEGMALLAKKDINLKSNIEASQAELETLERSIKKK